MKKILSLMLALLCVFALVACGGGSTPGGTTPPANELDVFEAAAKGTAPTNITSLTSYRTKDQFGKDLVLEGAFTLLVKGNESILDFEYQKLATLEDAADDFVVNKKGAIAIQAGKSKVILGDSLGNWETVIPSMQNVAALKIEKASLPADYSLSEDGKKLSVSLTEEEAKTALGVDIEAASEIAFAVETNGTYITSIVISYKAANNADVRIASSYTYGPQTLDFSRFN
ncbi:MAG: hypothetical protein IJW11_05165 [Clostridia bacterium]|nr:hypothetical protein [Clostridia bacterium]